MKLILIAALALTTVGCGDPPSSVGSRCSVNSDCPSGSTCFGGTCREAAADAGTEGRDSGGLTPDTGNVPAPDSGARPAPDAGVTPAPDTGAQQPDAGPPGGACEAHEDCPYYQYCNLLDLVCADLPNGTCRDDRSCVQRCEIPAGRSLGRCVDCSQDSDCQAPNTRCDRGTCRPPEGQCTDNADCAAGEQCVDGACEAGQGGCNLQNCPAPGQCIQDQCIGGGGGGQGGCTENADCPGQQCVPSFPMCMPLCNDGIFALLCQLPNNPLCICTPDGLTCNQGSGYCE
jgi:hypothetical protein